MNQGTDDVDERAIDAALRSALERVQRRLTPADVVSVRSNLDRQQRVLRRLRQVHLGNGIEPALEFNPNPSHRSKAVTP